MGNIHSGNKKSTVIIDNQRGRGSALNSRYSNELTTIGELQTYPNLKKTKVKELKECLDCLALIPKKGVNVRCKPCSWDHHQKQNKMYMRKSRRLI